MKTLSRFQLALAATVIALFALPFASYALVSYPPGSLLQPNDVATSTIRAYAVSPVKIASGLDFTMHGLTTTNATSTNATTTGVMNIGGTLKWNGISYTGPSTQGAANQLLSNDGAGNISWATAANNELIYSMQARDVIGVTTTPIAVMATTTKKYSIAYDTGADGTCDSGSNPNTLSITTGSGGNELVIAAFGNNGNAFTSPSSVTLDGTTMNVVGIIQTSTIGNYYDSVYSLVGVAPGTHTITYNGVNCSVGYSNFSTTAYSGVNQTTPIANIATTTTASLSLTTSTANAWIGAFGAEGSGSIGGGTNNSVRVSYSNGSINELGDSATQIPSAGSNTVSFSCGGTPCTLIAWDMQPAYQPFDGLVTGDAATQTDLNGYMGFITSTSTANTNQAVTFCGVLNGFVGLTKGSMYYLQNSGGFIGTVAGTVSKAVGNAIDSTHLRLFCS